MTDNMRRFFAGIFVVWGWAAAATSAVAATVPGGFSETVLTSTLQSPTAMGIAPDGRIFVCEQGGTLRIVKNGALLATPFLSLTVNSVGERGLLGVAFDPAFQSNSFVYVYYTATSPTIHNRISRFTASGDTAVPGSELVLMDLETLGASNHNGGAIHFGNDGKLYVGVGENANSANAQLLTNRLGKLLRLNSDGSIPTDNPFYNSATGDNRAIWALGLRNPFSFTVEPISGTIIINDVGQDTWEEINVGAAGANYGWPVTEGATSNPQFTSPLYAYDHTGACAIAGGAFHSLARVQFPATYWGAYFFADLCGGWIHARRSDGSVVPFASGITSPVDLKTGSDGSLYYLARGSGAATGVLARISYTLAAPRTNLTVNGSDGPLLLRPGNALNLALSFAGGATAFSGEIYAGLIGPSGILYADPISGTLTRTPTPLAQGVIPNFSGAAFGSIPDVAVLPAGLYWWFVDVDADMDGAPDWQAADLVLVAIASN